MKVYGRKMMEAWSIWWKWRPRRVPGRPVRVVELMEAIRLFVGHCWEWYLGHVKHGRVRGRHVRRVECLESNTIGWKLLGLVSWYYVFTRFSGKFLLIPWS